MSEREREISIDQPRCPFCHDQVGAADEKAGCPSCMAWHHASCWSEHGACSACGATGSGKPPKADPALAKITALARGGKKIEAIKDYRELHGVDLKTAKEAVDALVAGKQPAGRSASGATGTSTKGLDPEVEAALRAGRTIAAIKRYRELHGGDLRSARQAVEAICAELGLSPPPAPPHLAVLVSMFIAVGIAMLVVVLALRGG